jgi:hypothetical protein
MLDQKVTPVFRKLIRREFPDLDFKTALRLMRMGLIRLQKHARCGAWAKSRGSTVSSPGAPERYGPVPQPRRLLNRLSHISGPAAYRGGADAQVSEVES